MYGPQFGINIDDLPDGLDFVLNLQFAQLIDFINQDITTTDGEYEDDIVNTVPVDDLLYQVQEVPYMCTFTIHVLSIHS